MTGDDVLPPQIWAEAVNDDGFKPLEIDKFLLERANPARPPKIIRSLRDAEYIARRAMEVGYLEAMRARREQPGPIANDFGDLEKLAKNAATTLDDLIKHLEPRAAMARDLALPILTAQAGRLTTGASPSSRERRVEPLGRARYRAALEGGRIKERSTCQERAPERW